MTLPVFRSTTVTEVAGVAFCTKARAPSALNWIWPCWGETWANFGRMVTSCWVARVDTSNFWMMASTGPYMIRLGNAEATTPVAASGDRANCACMPVEKSPL